MCIVSAEAKLTKTKILSMALDNGRHLLSYANEAKNLSGKTNSMILPIPGKVDKKWFYDTTEYKDFLGDIHKQADVELNMYLSAGSKSRGISFDEFEVGFYKVVTTNDVDTLVEILGVYGPEISSELMEFFKTQYKGWSFVCCIFDGDKKMDAQPIMFEYEPFEYNYVYFPMMDSHTGGAPSLNSNVQVDHTLITEYPGVSENMIGKVKFSQEVPEILKRRKFVSTKWKQEMINGDMYIDIGELNSKSDSLNDIFSFFMRKSTHPNLIAQ